MIRRNPSLMEAVSFVAGVATFVVLGRLLSELIPQMLAISLSAFAMLLVGFPFTRYVSNQRLTFGRWALFSGLGAAAGFLLMSLISFR